MNNYKEIILKFLRKYFFVYKAAADGWRIKYHNKNQISFYNNINKIHKPLSNINYFTSYYDSKSSLFG